MRSKYARERERSVKLGSNKAKHTKSCICCDKERRIQLVFLCRTINYKMETPSRPDECWSISPTDPELDIHLLGIEGYSNLSDDNLNTILRSFTENLQQKSPTSTFWKR